MAVSGDEIGGLMVGRRELLRLGGVAAVSALLWPRLGPGLARAVGALEAGTGGFLTAAELATLDAAAAVLLPTDDRVGAREVGVVDYIQALLSFMPGTDANCDLHVNAADVTAVALRAAGRPADKCPGGGEVTGDGAVDEADVGAAAVAVFRARPMFGGGPFSGRTAQPHAPVGPAPCNVCHGPPGAGGYTRAGQNPPGVDAVPRNAFREFLPLTRLQALSWTVRLLGGEDVAELKDNPLAVELPGVGLRHKYRVGLAALDAASGASFAALSTEEQRMVLDLADPDFVTLLTQHVIEGTLCAPEYGGNRGLRGWALAGFDGDSQPLGYTVYDDAAPGNYRERPEKPNSGPNPGQDCGGFSSAMDTFLGLISAGAGGRRLGDPYCLGVDR